MPKRAGFERSRRELSLDVSVGVLSLVLHPLQVLQTKYFAIHGTIHHNTALHFSLKNGCTCAQSKHGIINITSLSSAPAPRFTFYPRPTHDVNLKQW